MGGRLLWHQVGNMDREWERGLVLGMGALMPHQQVWGTQFFSILPCKKVSLVLPVVNPCSPHTHEHISQRSRKFGVLDERYF